MERLLDNKFESCLIFIKGDADKYKFNKPRVPQKYLNADPREGNKNPRGRCIGNIIRIPAYRPPNVKQLSYHVAAFPEELVAFFLQCYTNKNDVVLDPFLGSGTTLKVARVMGRKGFGYELNKNYGHLIGSKIKELWEVPDWRNLDILHSMTSTRGQEKPRKIHFQKKQRSKLAGHIQKVFF
jgi:DNA modification methylase